MSKNRKEKRELSEDQKERIQNDHIYSGWITDWDRFVGRYARKFSKKNRISTTLNKVNKTRPELVDQLVKYFPIPDHLNHAATILLILDKYYDIEEEDIAGFITWIFDKYTQPAWDIWYDNYRTKDFKFKYTDKDIIRELKARGYKKAKYTKTDLDGNYLIHYRLGYILPRMFDAHVNSLRINNPGIYLAQSLYGFNTSVYIGTSAEHSSNKRWLKSNTIN